MTLDNYRLLINSIREYCIAVEHFESRASMLCTSRTTRIVPHMAGATEIELWQAIKSASHFLLGNAIELLLKLLLLLNGVKYDRVHALPGLYDLLPDKVKVKLEADCRARWDVASPFNLVALMHSGTPPSDRPQSSDVGTFRIFLDYFFLDVRTPVKRYVYETESGKWEFYIDDVSIFLDVITSVAEGVRNDLAKQDPESIAMSPSSSSAIGSVRVYTGNKAFQKIEDLR